MKTPGLIAAAFAAVSLLSSCKQDISIPTTEGLPATVSISIAAPSPVEVAATKATDLQETNISSLALFFYSKSNTDAPKCVVELSGSDLANYKTISTTNYIYTIEFDDAELTSGEYYLYAVANYDSSNFGTVSIADLKGLSLDALKALVINKNNTLLDMIESSLLLTGFYGRTDGSITLQPGENVITEERVHLRRMTAKIIFKFATASGITFTPETYSVYNYPVSTTLMERQGWQTNGNKEDNVSGTFPGSLEHIGDLTNVTNNNWKGDSLMFYMLENVQASTTGLSDYNDRDRHVSASDQTFANAPAGATYVVVKGKYQDSSVSGDVTYTFHLGNFGAKTGSNDNFTVRRNGKYRYNVTIKGVNNIIAEAEYTDNDYAAGETNSGAEGNLVSNSTSQTNITVDAHYETVMVKIPASLIKSGKYIITSNTPKEDVTYTSGSGAAQPTDVSWIKFAKPASTKTFYKYPGSSSTYLTDIYGLINDLQSSESDKTYAIKSGNYYYTTAFVDEYVYSGLPFKEYVNAPERKLTWASSIAVSKDGKSTYASEPLFTISQRSMKSIFNLEKAWTEKTNPFGIENYEEFSGKVNLQPDGNKEPSNIKGDRSFGWDNTYSYISKLSSDDKKWEAIEDVSYMGHFDGSQTISTKAWQSSKNTAIYQCLSRNRDENGNGTIDQDEVKWYLPALSQCEDIWYGYKILDSQAEFNLNEKLYWTSSNGDKREWWIDEGVSFGKISQGSKVRCIRSLGTYNAETLAESTYSSSTRIVNVNNLGAGATRTSGSVTNEYIAHERNAEPDVLPEAFQIARENVKTESGDMKFTYAQITSGNICHDNYYENSDKSDKGLWRVPNEREFGLMIKNIGSEFGNSEPYPAARSYYYRQFDDKINTAYASVGSRVTTGSDILPETSTEAKCIIRCVRDVTPTE